MAIEQFSPNNGAIQTALKALEEKIDSFPERDRIVLTSDLQNLKELIQHHLPSPTDDGASGGPVERQSDKSPQVVYQKASEILESIADAFYAVDSEWRLIYVNERTEKWWGRTRESLIGTSLWDLFPQQEHTESYQSLMRAMQKRVPVHYEVNSPVIKTWVDVHVYPASDGGLSVYFRDISERKLAEAALRESESKFQAIFHNTPIAVILFRLADGVVIDVNPAWLDLFGFSREEVIGKTAADRNLITDPDLRAHGYTELRSKGYLRSFEVTYRTAHKGMVVASYNADRIVIDGTEYILSTIENITERKQAENALRLSESALRESVASERDRANEVEALMNAAPALIWITRDPESKEMTSNQYGYEYLQVRSDLNISKTSPAAKQANARYQFMKDGHPIPPTELPMQTVAASGKPVRDYTMDLVFDDGRVCHLLGNVNPLLDQEGKPRGAIGVFTDVTELYVLEQQQSALREQMHMQQRLLEQREKDRQAIARDIHDGPVQSLTSVQFNIEFAKDAFTDPMQRAELDRIALDVRNAAQELRHVIAELRPPATIRFGLARAVRSHIEDLREKQPELKVSLHIEDEGAVLSEMVRLTLFRVYQESMTNVVRHAQAAKVWVRLRIKVGNVVLQIRDNGVGLPENSNFENIIQSGHYGLAGIKERTEVLGGKLIISSEPGKGTTVRVNVPVPEGS